MAVTTSPTGAAAATPEPRRAESAPFWITGLYLGGLVLVYVGERVLSGMEKGAGFVTVLGLLLAIAGTVLRFSPRFRTGGERKSIETLLAVLSVVGLAGLLIYFATSSFGFDKLGFSNLTLDKRTRVEELGRVLWVSLIIVSVVPIVFAETALRPMRNAERPESRRVRSAATAGLALALAGLYGSLFVYAAGGIDWKADYSYFKTSRPSESTRKLAQSLSGEPVRVVAFFPDVNEVRGEVQGYLRDLANGAPKLKVEVVDRVLSPKLAKELRANQDGVIVLSRGSVNQTLTIGTEVDQVRPKLKTLDRDFQEQLLKVAHSKRLAYLTVGHGELNDITAGSGDGAAGRTARLVKLLLQKQNYQLKDLGLGQGLAKDVPEDADVVLVLGPTGPFTKEELASLTRYADRGGRLVLALDPDAIAATSQITSDTTALIGKDEKAAKPPAKPPKPVSSAEPPAPPPESPASDTSFNAELASVVGIKYAPDVLANERNHVRVRYNDSDRTRLVANSFSSHASVSTLSRNAPRAAVVLFGTASLESQPGAKGKVDFALRSMSQTFQDTNRNYAHEPNEKTQTFNLAAAITRPVGPAKPEEKKPEEKKDASKPEPDKDKKEASKPEPQEMRAFVLADADALSDFVLGEVMSNQILFVDVVRWLVGETSIQGVANTEEDVKIEHTKQADLGWFYATIFGVPGLVLGAGLLLSRRSRGGRK